MNKKSLLYIGGSHSQIAGIRCAQDVGLFVAVTDRSSTAPARAIADRFENIAADNDDGLLELAWELHRKYGLAAAYGFSDYAYGAIGRIYEELGLTIANRELYGRLADKGRTKQHLLQAGIPVPRGHTVLISACKDAQRDVTMSGLCFPLVVKPAEVDSSQAVTTVTNDTELKAAIVRAGSLGEKVIVEEFVDGEHVNVDMVFIEGQGYPLSITERHFLDCNHHQPLSGLQRSTTETEQERRLFSLLREACHALNFRNGPVTADVIVGTNGPKILELSPHVHSITLSRLLGHDRVLGGWFAYVAGCSDWRERLILAQHQEYAAYYYAYSTTPGRVVAIEGWEKLQMNKLVKHVDLKVKLGSEIQHHDGHRKTCAIITMQGEDRATILALMGNLKKSLVWKTTER